MSYNTFEEASQYVLDYLKSETDSKNVLLHLNNSENVVTGGLECSGYFSDNPTPELAVAIGKSPNRWIPIAIHESCHMDQWYENSPLWKLDNLGILDNWLNGEDYDYDFLKSNTIGCLTLELDCEKRSVEKFIKLGLDNIVNTTEYIQKSNAYVLFYLAMLRERKWYSTDKRPYEIEELWRNMPHHWDNDYENENNPLVDLIIQKCF